MTSLGERSAWPSTRLDIVFRLLKHVGCAQADEGHKQKQVEEKSAKLKLTELCVGPATDSKLLFQVLLKFVYNVSGRTTFQVVNMCAKNDLQL